MAFRRLFLLPFTSNLTTIKPNVQQQLSTHIRAFSTLFSNTKHWESNFVKPTCLNSFSRQQSSLMGIHQKMKEALQINLGNLQARPEGKKFKRVGRGPSSGHGKTSARGAKGQHKRNSVPIGFEGGQTPYHMRFPKRGARNIYARPLEVLNLDRLQYWISTGRISAEQPITLKVLQDSGCVTRIKHGVKLLGQGSHLFESKVEIEVTKATKEAISTIEKQGGTIRTRYFDNLGLRVHLHPEKFDPLRLPRLALPNKAKDREYYGSWERRGYLSNQTQTPAN